MQGRLLDGSRGQSGLFQREGNDREKEEDVQRQVFQLIKAQVGVWVCVCVCVCVCVDDW